MHDYFKLTLHALADDQNRIWAETLEAVAAEMNTLRQTHLLHQAHFVAEGRALVCLWIKKPEPPAAFPLGFAVV